LQALADVHDAVRPRLEESHDRPTSSRSHLKTGPHPVSKLRPGSDDDLSGERNTAAPPQALEKNLSLAVPLRFRPEVHERAPAATLVIRTGRLAPRRRRLEKLDDPRAHEITLALDGLDEKPISGRRARDEHDLTFVPPETDASGYHLVDENGKHVLRHAGLLSLMR
jgi:hypothetical protein